MAAATLPAVLQHLESATERHPLDRKLLVCTSMGEGRELLRALARYRRSWIGWEITTPRRLALDLVGPSVAADGRSVADPYEEQAAVDEALDRALELSAFEPLRGLAETPGFRQAVLNSVEALRLASVDPGGVEAVAGTGALVPGLVARVLEGYRQELGRRSLVDTADIVEAAIPVVRRGGVVDPARTYLAPGLSRRGVTGRLLATLQEAGATTLRSDPVEGVDPPPLVWDPAVERAPLSGLTAGVMESGPGAAVELSLFAASGPGEEIREILRRAMAAGLQWDEIEIIATDPVVYGGALHAAAERLGVPVSYAVGLPVERTRPGRATAAYFRWIEEGYPADGIRRLLESGDLAAPADGPTGLALARHLRRLRIGWGYDRYRPAIDRALKALETPRPRPRETEEEARERARRGRTELEALQSILDPILQLTPRLERGTDGQQLSPADLARGLQGFLSRVPAGDDPSSNALDRLLAIAGRIQATLTRPTAPPAALAVLRRHLEIRVPAPQREGAAPWVSAGGHIHLADIEHGGYSARPATFVVGLDADRFPGAGLQDPLLLDGQRRALDSEALPTSGDRLLARRFALAACLARLRGTVTLSYSAWDPTEAREVAPASVLLQAYRAVTGRPEASFQDLETGLGQPASPVARTAAVDAVDVWFRALDRGGVLQDGTAVVREAYPDLHRGLLASEALGSGEATPWHGAVRPRPEALDPRLNAEAVMSASGLEDLGSCGLRYLYRYGLRVRKPDDPELDPDTWLNALDRGRLLHGVYEASLREAREAGIRAGHEAFERLALQVLEREARSMAREVPPPGEAIRARELEGLRSDVRSFAHMMDGRDDRWEALELQFGLGGRPVATLQLKGGGVSVRGAIDRVDRSADGLVVVDYKTGGPGHYERRHGTFHGGRRLQHVVYSAVAEQLLEERVARMEYHFPTRTGRNDVLAYDRSEVRRGLGLIDRLLDGVASGRFLPTEDPSDCRFCDYAPICRHRSEGWSADTPRADWAAAHFGALPEYRERRDTRSWDETFLAELEHGEAS
jgi:ATP-dependent helicase/nuclease subunit B